MEGNGKEKEGGRGEKGREEGKNAKIKVWLRPKATIKKFYAFVHFDVSIKNVKSVQTIDRTVTESIKIKLIIT